MNLTQTLRNYLLDNKGSFFDVGYEHKRRFGMFDKASLIRVLMRLDKDEHIITWVAKGVYFINDGTELSEEKIISYYTNDEHGMLIGNALFKKLGIIADFNGPIEILTNRTASNKNIGNLKIIQTDMLGMNKEIIIPLEILEKCKNVENITLIADILDACLRKFYMFSFDLVIPHIKYHASTIAKYSNLLDSKGIKHKCFESFAKYCKQ